MSSKNPGRFDEFAIQAAPAVFVLFWSTGFIGAKYGLPYAEPLTFLALRFALVLPMVGIFALIMRVEWPRGMALLHNAVSGLLLHGLYLSGVFIAIHRGMPAGIAALLVSLQPILTSTLANRLLGEPVRPIQWAGLALGLVGVYFIVEGRIGDGEASLFAGIAIFVALVGVTLGTRYEKRFGGGGDLRAARAVH
jgi:drug/metabolite transporter (DMT)-like permease